MTDVQLLNEFSHSDTSADARYKDKILELSGILKKSETDNQAANAVFDKGGTVIIVAAFVPAEREALSQLAQGALLHFKGQYRGYIKGDELFGTPAEIKIDQCSILK